jgi:hypothetical protein
MAIIRDKQAYHERTTAEMERHLLDATWSVRQKVALACRMLSDEGHESALAGQITVRADQPGTYWMLSFGLGFDEAQANNIVRVDDDLNLLEGNGMVNPSNRFHLWIYRHRPEVNAIIHTHPPYISALSMVGEALVASHMDTSMFYDDCAYLPEWPGPPIGVYHGGRSGGAGDFYRACGTHAIDGARDRADPAAESGGCARSARLPLESQSSGRDLSLLCAPYHMQRPGGFGVVWLHSSPHKKFNKIK